MKLTIKKALSVLLALVMMLSIFAVTTINASAKIIPNNFASKAYDYYKYITTNLKNRDTISGPDFKPAQDYIVSELKAAGYTDEDVTLQEFTFRRRNVTYTSHNIVAVKKGLSDEQIIIGSHYDGDGAGDNGSGIALNLATATGIANLDVEKTIVFIWFSAEEYGTYGSNAYANAMTDEEVAKTELMINMDALVAGDYCNVYGGVADKTNKTVSKTEGYEKAMEIAERLNLDLHTNPWTWENPEPGHTTPSYPSPTTGDWSDHKGFKNRGITYLYLEATNWYIGDYDGYDESVDHGAIMNTSKDTFENLEAWFPGRAQEHFTIFSSLLNELIPISKIEVSYDETAVTGQNFTITVNSQSDVISFLLKNEKGNNVTIKSKTSRRGSDGNLTWTITAAVASPGEREFQLIPVSTSRGLGDAYPININVADATEPVSIVSAKFTDRAALVNKDTQLKVVTGRAVNTIAVQNEKGAKMGKTLDSVVKNSDGSKTWNYSMKIGTAGNRTFTVIANDTVTAQASIVVAK